MASCLTPEEMSSSLRRKASKQKRKIAKNVLHIPYKLLWPQISKDEQTEIIASLKRVFKDLGLGRLKQSQRESQETGSAEKSKESEEMKNIRSQVVIGTNAVTRSLEKDSLQLVLICRSAAPYSLTKYLIGLSAIRSCPAGCLSDLSQTITELFNIHSAMAIGFKKWREGDSKIFKDFINNVKLPVIECPWLRTKLSSARPTKLGSDCKQTGQQNIPAVTAESYSRFYIYKNKKETNQNFIAFSENSDEENKITNRLSERLRFRKDQVVKGEVVFKQANIRQMKSNMKRRKKKL